MKIDDESSKKVLTAIVICQGWPHDKREKIVEKVVVFLWNSKISPVVECQIAIGRVFNYSGQTDQFATLNSKPWT